MAWEKHVVWDNKAQTKALAEELGQLQPEGADGGSTVWDEAEELAKKEAEEAFIKILNWMFNY